MDEPFGAEDEPLVFGTVPQSDACALAVIFWVTAAGLGVCVGWVVACATVDRPHLVDEFLRAHNCTDPCPPWDQAARRWAADQYVRVAFAYCGWGALAGLGCTLAMLLWLTCRWTRVPHRQRCQDSLERCRDCYIQHCRPWGEWLHWRRWSEWLHRRRWGERLHWRRWGERLRWGWSRPPIRAIGSDLLEPLRSDWPEDLPEPRSSNIQAPLSQIQAPMGSFVWPGQPLVYLTHSPEAVSPLTPPPSWPPTNPNE